MKTIHAYFSDRMKESIKSSYWFKTAPKNAQKTAKFKFLGVEDRKYGNFFGSTMRPAVIALCECGGETQKFSMLIEGTFPVEAID